MRSTIQTRGMTAPAGLRIAPWRHAARTAQLVPVQGTGPLSTEAIAATASALLDDEFDRVITPALMPADHRAFLGAGFRIQERLYLLSHDLRTLPAAPRVATRRSRRRDRDDIIRVDNAAFEPFWRLDADGIKEALAATPHRRFRVVGRPAVGYAIAGRAGTRGYVQRLAVDPRHHGEGLGIGLLLDALRWLARHRVREALVNTQYSNDRALALYEQAGFTREPSDLAVMVLDRRS